MKPSDDKPLFDSVEDVLVAVNEYVQNLNTVGGKFEFPFYMEREPRKPNPFRLSSSGKCTRRMAYEKLLPEEQEEIGVRALNVFMLGDVVHELDRHLIAEVTHLHSVEKTVEFYVNEEVGSVKGHTDGVIELSDGPIVLDVKTAATASFARMVRDGPDMGYRAQLNAYMHALGIKRGVLWVYDKNTSHRAVIPVDYDEDIVEQVRERFARTHAATLDDLPPREFEAVEETRYRKPTGREYLPWQCGYCPFVERCWGSEGFEKVIERGKPRWIRDTAAWEAAQEFDKEMQLEVVA